MRPPRASVVVVTRDRAKRLEALLASLAAQDLPHEEFEVVVIDDGSTDDTQALLRRWTEPPLRVIRAEDRPGLAELRNRGWRAGRAPLVCFIDDDCEADAGWLRALLAAAEADPDAFVQGRTTPIDRERDKVGPLSRTKLIEAAGPWFQTCNIAYPRGLLERLGGFDRAFTVAGEDTDLGWRALAAGAQARYAPGARARHAVERIGIRGWLAIARRERPLGALFARHPGLRAEVGRLGVFKGPEHALPIISAAGLLAGRRSPLAAALTLPYALALVRRLRADRAGAQWLVWYIAYDLIAIVYAARGAAETGSRLI